MAQPSFDSILNAVMQAESGGRRYDSRGNLLTSDKGAKGEMQVLDTTKFQPGFGVEPAKANTPDERARVGRDYLRAMLDRYGDIDKALAAYNWGPGNTDKWIARGADPAKLPAETQGYISKIKSSLTGGPRTTAQASATPEAAPAAAPARGAPAAAPTKVSEARPADLGPSYQAALALSFLSDEDEKESGRREYDERQPSAASQWLARETRKVTPESLAMPFRSPFAEPEPVKAADGGFIAVGYQKGGEARSDRMERIKRTAPGVATLNDWARTVAQDMYPREADAQKRDAARHMMAAAIMADKTGPGMAEALGKAYELKEAPLRTMGHWLGLSNPRPDYATDTFNNALGTRFANVAKDPLELQRAVRASIERGEANLTPDEIRAPSAYAEGGEAKTGEWKDGPPPELPPEEPFIPGLSSMRPKERTAKDMLRQAYHSARNFVEDAPLTPMAIGMEGALMLADRYNLMPPHMRQLMNHERERRQFLREQRMKGYADGGEAKSDEPTAEELERASKAAFGIVPSSGKGRKQSRVSDALQSGEAQLAAAKGLTMLPQNVVGAPVDIATLVARPFGYNVEKPVMGSDWLKEKTRAAGLAFQEPEDPTLRAFFTAGDISSNLINPAGATRTAVRGAQKTGQAAKELAEFAARPVERDPFLSGPMGAQRGAIRLPGGHFQLESTFGKVANEPVQYRDPIPAFIESVYPPTRDKALNDWFDKRVTTYFRRDVGTERDPFVLAAEQGRKTHHTLSSDAVMDSAFEMPKHIQEARRAEGMDPRGIAKTPRGQRLEYASDRAIVPSELQDVGYRMIPPGLRQFVETDPSMRLYSIGDVGNLQLGPLKRDLFAMRNQGPEYSKHGFTANIPQEYRISDSALQGLTLDQASERVALFRDWKNKTNQRLAVKAIKQDPDIARTQLSDGSVWVEPPDLIENPKIRDMVLDVGCAGGWCTKEEVNAEAYGATQNRLAILFGPKGSPEAQLTITRNQPDVKDFLRFNPEMQQLFGVTPNQLHSMDVRAAIYRSPQFRDWMSVQPPNMSITEIKGAQNKGNIVDQPYVKKVQEYVQNLDKQYELLNVENLKGIGLEDLLSHVRNAFPRGFPIREEQIPAIQKEAVRLNGGTRYISVLPDLSSMNELLVQAYKNVTQR